MTEKRKGRHHDIARAIVDHLPGVWHYSEKDSREYYAVLLDRDGSGIKLRMEDQRLKVVGVWPAPISGHHHNHMFEPIQWGLDEPRITCNPDRGLEAIAKDITRRMLRLYAPLYLAMLDKRAEQIAEDVLEKEVIQKLLVAGAENATRNKVYFGYDSDAPHGSIEVKVRGDEVQIDINVRGIPLETALHIIAEIADCKYAIKTGRMEVETT